MRMQGGSSTWNETVPEITGGVSGTRLTNKHEPIPSTSSLGPGVAVQPIAVTMSTMVRFPSRVVSNTDTLTFTQDPPDREFCGKRLRRLPRVCYTESANVMESDSDSHSDSDTPKDIQVFGSVTAVVRYGVPNDRDYPTKPAKNIWKIAGIIATRLSRVGEEVLALRSFDQSSDWILAIDSNNFPIPPEARRLVYSVDEDCWAQSSNTGHKFERQCALDEPIYNDDHDYTVLAVLGRRQTSRGTEYLILWKLDLSSTWELGATCGCATSLIREFHRSGKNDYLYIRQHKMWLVPPGETQFPPKTKRIHKRGSRERSHYPNVTINHDEVDSPPPGPNATISEEEMRSPPPSPNAIVTGEEIEASTTPPSPEAINNADWPVQGFQALNPENRLTLTYPENIQPYAPSRNSCKGPNRRERRRQSNANTPSSSSLQAPALPYVRAQCNNCEKTFCDNHRLKRHTMQCQECGRYLCGKINFNKHMKIHK